jgi:hypothetical protein
LTKYRWTLGIKSFRIIPSHDGQILVEGQEIKRWAPEFQIFRSDKFSVPRDPSGKLMPETKERADSVTTTDLPTQPSAPKSPTERENGALLIRRELAEARARPLIRRADQSGQDPVTGEVNPRLAKLIRHPAYKKVVDRYFAHLNALTL